MIARLIFPLCIDRRRSIGLSRLKYQGRAWVCGPDISQDEKRACALGIRSVLSVWILYTGKQVGHRAKYRQRKEKYQEAIAARKRDLVHGRSHNEYVWEEIPSPDGQVLAVGTVLPGRLVRPAGC